MPPSDNEYASDEFPYLGNQPAESSTQAKKTKVSVAKVTKKEDGRRQYDKKLACYYCGNIFKHRIHGHLDACHGDEADVAAALAKTGNQRKYAIEKIKNMGNYRHNIHVLSSGGGELIVARRSGSQKMEPADYLPCIYCLAFCKSDELWRHCKTCHHRKQGSDDTGVLCKARMLLEGGLQEEGNVGDKGMQDLQKHVLLTMRKDAAFKALKEDTLILQFGNVLLRKLGPRRKNDVAQRMRQLSRLKLELADDGPSIQLTDYLSGSCFDEVVSAVEIVAGMQENTQGIRVFDTPSLALRLGHNLLKCAEMKRGLGIRQQNSTTKAEAETYIQLHSSEWTDKVSSIALATLKTNNFNKPEMLPITADLVLLKNFLMKTTDDLNNEICQSPTYECWRALAEATLSRVILFNKRRGSEASKLLLQTYVSRPNWAASANKEILASLQPMEAKLLDRLDMVQTQGKQNKRVPVLFTPDMKRSIDNLVTHRDAVGIKADNKYLFATAAEGHLDSWQVLQNAAKTAGCKQPNLISSTRLRKYIATVCQVCITSTHLMHLVFITIS